MKSNKGNWILTGVLLLISIAFTVAIKVVDVLPVGVDGSEVGFATINMKFHEMTGVNYGWFSITEVLGYVALLMCAGFGLVGLVQLIKRRSLFKVDKCIIALGVLYVIVIALYVGFDKIALNYRPIIMPGDFEPEASFPSSHTMLACVVFGTANFAWAKYLRNRPVIKWLLLIESIILIALTVGGRMYSGVHWMTDIVGGVLYSITLISGYYAAIKE